MEDKPFGWRPYDDETRAELAGQGFSDAEIAKMEAGNVYQPIRDAVLSVHFAAALLDVMARRHGASVITDFRRALERQSQQLAASEQVEDRVDGKIVQEAIDRGINWQAFIDRASDPDHESWSQR